MIYEHIILGAGASGMFCASFLNSPTTVIIDSNPKIAAKVKISGGGKCNITNKYMNSSYFLGNKEFVDRVLDVFGEKELLKLLKSYKIEPILNPKIVKGTLFCKSSDEVIEFLSKSTKKCRFFLDTTIEDIGYKDGVFELKSKDKSFFCKNLIVASGGLSFATLGASDIAYKIAQYFKHPIKPTNPALVGFTVQKEQFWFKDLSGLSLDVSIQTDTKVIDGSLLFAHKGISGPAVLSSSLYWQKGSLSIDFMPKNSLQNYKNSKQSISNALPLPKRFVSSFLKSIDLEDKALYKLTNKEFDKLLSIHNYSFAPAGNFGYSKAEVTKGGIDVEFLDEFMQSKLIKNLYFIGEAVDVTGELGGYNLQWAFSSAYVASSNLKNKTVKKDKL